MSVWVPADDERFFFWLQLQSPCDLSILSCCARTQTCLLTGRHFGTLHNNTHQKQAAALSVNVRTQDKHQLVVLYNCDQRCVLDAFPGQFPWMTPHNDNEVDPRAISATRKLMSSDLGIKLCQNCPLSQRDLQLRCPFDLETDEI